MNILVNGVEQVVVNTSLKKIIEEMGFAGKNFAVAVNENFVPRANYESVELNNGDQLDIVAPMQGG